MVITLIWSILGVGSWLLEYLLSFGSPEGPMTLGRAAARLVYAVLWWCVSAFAVWIADTLTIHRVRQYYRWAFHILMGGLVAVAWAVVAYYICLAIVPGWLPLGVGRMVNTTFMTSYFYYVGFVVVVHAIISRREAHAREIRALQKDRVAAESQRVAAESQLHALKMEIQPHFLFNTLNTISALMHRDVKAANDMLVLLADMLEVALANVRDQEVTLQKELDTLKLYVRIQQTRFGERLKVDYDIDPEALGIRVPHLVFQPLVENAIKNGISNRAAGGRLEISARVVDEELQLAVHDDGVGLRNSRPDSGVGLKTPARGWLSYTVIITSSSFAVCRMKGTRAEITIPLRGHADLNLNR